MKKLLLSAILAVSAFAVVSSVDAANTLRKHEGARGCSNCLSAPAKCEARPTCVKLVEAYEPACKSCEVNCVYTCPVGTTTRFDKE